MTAIEERPAQTKTPLVSLATRNRVLVFAVALFVLLSFIRAITDATSLTSASTIGTTVRFTIPILLAGLAALWAERAGIINIGVEGMMILGTWFGGWAAWQWGGWVGLLMACVGGMIGGLIMGIAVVRFNTDHIIAGVAINLLAFGAMRYLSELVFVGEQNGGISQSPPQSSAIPKLNVPFLAGGWDTPDALRNLEERGWFLVSDIAGVLGGLTRGVSWASVLAVLLVPLSAWVLFRTVFGLRLRSSGESPFAGESLGVKILPLRYQAMLISGGLAGLGGGYAAIVLSSFYREGQTLNRGFIGLAVNIFGNYNPFGILAGAALFGFGEALNLVGASSLPKLVLYLGILGALGAIWAASRQRWISAAVQGVGALCALAIFIWVDKIPEPLTKSVPFVLTLLVLSVSTNRLRPPAFGGKPYEPGQQH